MKKLVSFALILVVLALSGNPQPAQPARARGAAPLTVFAASSLTDTFTEIGAAFQAEHPGVEIVFNFAGSSALATQLAEGAPADVFASANNKQMQAAQDAGRIAGEPGVFAHNRLVVIVPADNPAGIASLADLARPGVLLVVAAPGVPVRDYTDQMLDKLAAAADYGTPYRDGFLANIVSEEENVRQVAVKVALGEADAGIVYQSDVTPDLAREVRTLPVPDDYNVIATYPIAVTNDSPSAALAGEFVAFVLAPQGQWILARWNFLPAEPLVWPAAACTLLGRWGFRLSCGG